MITHRDSYLVDFQVISSGLIYAFVCSSLGEQETTDRLNLLLPIGVLYRWKPSTDDTFVTGQPNPCRCELRPNTHVHRLYAC